MGGLKEKHPTSINGIPINEKFGEEVGKLRYDILDKFLRGLSNEITKQKEHDKTIGNIKLSAELREVESGLLYALGHMKAVLHICKSHIDAEKSSEKNPT